MGRFRNTKDFEALYKLWTGTQCVERKTPALLLTQTSSWNWSRKKVKEESKESGSESVDLELQLRQLSNRSDLRQSFKGGTLAANRLDDDVMGDNVQKNFEQ